MNQVTQGKHLFEKVVKTLVWTTCHLGDNAFSENES